MTLVALLCALQKGECFYCGVRFSGPVLNRRGRKQSHQWSREHVLPLSKGGKLYVLACVGCNSAKGCRLPSADEMRRAVSLRNQVDVIGRALQGDGWCTLEQEKARVREKIDAAHVKAPVYRCPKDDVPVNAFECLSALAN